MPINVPLLPIQVEVRWRPRMRLRSTGRCRVSAVAVLGIALGFFGSPALVVAGDNGADPVARQDPPDDEEPGRPIAPARPPAFLVRGLVIDAATKRPVARFRVIPGVWNGREVTWQPHLITTHRNGLFEWPKDGRAWEELRIRIEAEGYRPGISRVVQESEGPIRLRFDLEADAGLSVIVRTPEGTPAAGAQAAWATPSREATGRGPTLTFSGHAERLGAQVVTADNSGRLRLAPESDRGMIVVAHSSGYAEVRPADLGATGVVTLRRWCRVEGRVLAGTKPVAGQKVRVYRIGSPGEDPTTHSWEDEVITGADGGFVCNRVIAGRVVVDRVFSEGPSEWSVNGLATFIEVREGEATQVTLGGPGRALIGRFRAPRDLDLPIDWSKVIFRIGLDAPHIGFPGDEAIWRSYRTFLNTEEGKAYHRDRLPVGPDGSFRVDSLPPGHFQLMIWVFGPAVGRPDDTREYYAAGGARVEMSPVRDDRGDEPMSIGTIELRKNPRNK